MNQPPLVILVSPGAHYPSHHWSNTVALMRALRRKGRPVAAVIFTAGTEPIPPDLAGGVHTVFSRAPLPWRRVSAGRWEEHRLVPLMSVVETVLCVFKALRLARRHAAATLHFLSGNYWVVVLAALGFPRLGFVCLLTATMLSGPATGLKARLRPHLRKLVQRATSRGRLDFISENEFVRGEMEAMVGSHVHLIPYAIDDTEALPSQEEARRRLELPLREKIVLFFGTHRREKDYHTALQGLLRLPEPPLALFVGKVISANDPRQVVADCRYPKARVVDQFVPEALAPCYFAAADAVVLPYQADFSRGSGVLIECCRHLRPMIASATPYLSWFLARYRCGLGYTPGDSAAFAAAAAQLLAGGEGYRAALAQARRDHSWTAAAEQYVRLYDARLHEDFPPRDQDK